MGAGNRKADTHPRWCQWQHDSLARSLSFWLLAAELGMFPPHSSRVRNDSCWMDFLERHDHKSPSGQNLPAMMIGASENHRSEYKAAESLAILIPSFWFTIPILKVNPFFRLTNFCTGRQQLLQVLVWKRTTPDQSFPMVTFGI